MSVQNARDRAHCGAYRPGNHCWQWRKLDQYINQFSLNERHVKTQADMCIRYTRLTVNITKITSHVEPRILGKQKRLILPARQHNLGRYASFD